MVINTRSAVGMAAIWLFAVATVSATAWFAIDRAGRDITSATGSTLPLPPLTTPTRDSQPTTAAPTPSMTPAPSPRPTTTAAPTPLASPSATSTPTTSAAPTPPATPRPPVPVTRYRTINVTGGLVTVRCTGAAIRLQNAQPENEWRVHVDTDTAGRIEVTFRKSEDEEETRRTQVTAACANGTPAFKVSTDPSH